MSNDNVPPAIKEIVVTKPDRRLKELERRLSGLGKDNAQASEAPASGFSMSGIATVASGASHTDSPQVLTPSFDSYTTLGLLAALMDPPNAVGTYDATVEIQLEGPSGYQSIVEIQTRQFIAGGGFFPLMSFGSPVTIPLRAGTDYNVRAFYLYADTGGLGGSTTIGYEFALYLFAQPAV